MKNKILIIDDEELLREGISSELTSEGYVVYEASNGKEGIEKAKKNLPDLIICDVDMPGIDGYEIIKIIRSLDRTSTIPIILITGVMKDYPHIRHGMNVGADDYLAKPFTISDLLISIRSVISKKENLRKKMESKSEELRLNIALALPHELRTPLGVIMGFSEILQTGFDKMDREEIGMIAQMMQEASQRLHKLIETYIDYSKIELFAKDESSLVKARKEITPNIDVIIESQTKIKAAEYNRTPDIKMELQSASAKISIEHFVKIISNVLENAFKYSKPSTPIIVNCYVKDNYCYVNISGSGCGILSEHISKINGHIRSEKKVPEQQGLSLGLITAKRLVEAYEGTFTIESQKNQGTTITIKLNSA